MKFRAVEFLRVSRVAAFAAVSVVLGCSTVPIDSAMSADDGNAATAVFCGFGRCERGYLFRQIPEGSGTTQTIRLVIGKKLKCGRPACVEFQFFNPDGSDGFGGSIPEGETEAAFTLGDLIGSATVRPEHDAEWLGKVVAWFKDGDGETRKTYGHGFIRLNVTKPDYQPLTCGGPAVAWKVKLGKDCRADFTTAFRSALCGKGCQNVGE